MKGEPCKRCGKNIDRDGGMLCKVCHNIRMREIKNDNHAKYVNEIKRINPNGNNLDHNDVIVEHDPGPYETSLPPKARFGTREFYNMVVAGYINEGVRVLVGDEFRYEIVNKEMRRI